MTSLSTKYVFWIVLFIRPAVDRCRCWELFLAQAVCTGLGNGLLSCPALAVLSTYFLQNRSLAIGIAASGSATSGLIYPAIVQQLLPKIGFSWSMRVVGFVMLVTQIFSVSFTKQRLPPRKLGPLVEWPAFREAPYTLFTIGIFISYVTDSIRHVPKFLGLVFCLLIRESPYSIRKLYMSHPPQVGRSLGISLVLAKLSRLTICLS